MANGSNGVKNANPNNFKSAPKKVDNNVVSKKAPVKFSAKRDSLKRGK